MTQQVITLKAGRYITNDTINRINEAVADKVLGGIFFYPDSLFMCSIDILVSDPEPIIVEKIVHSSPGKGNGTSRYRGVYWDKECKRWRAQLSHKGKRKMKRFDSEIDAAKQYDEWALEVRALGGKAYLNFESVVK